MIMGRDTAFETIGSLAGFSKLKKISITADLLLGYQNCKAPGWYSYLSRNESRLRDRKRLSQCLPRLVEHLQLKDCGDAIYGEVTELMIEESQSVPKLKIITLGFFAEADSENVDSGKRSRFKMGGILDSMRMRFGQPILSVGQRTFRWRSIISFVESRWPVIEKRY